MTSNLQQTFLFIKTDSTFVLSFQGIQDNLKKITNFFENIKSSGIYSDKDIEETSKKLDDAFKRIPLAFGEHLKTQNPLLFDEEKRNKFSNKN